MNKLAVVALGGNALLRAEQKGSIEEQIANTMDTLENLIHLLKDGYNLVITHGNGPQVGNILMRNDAGEQIYGITPMPLDICVADSQGGIGYMIERCILNILKKHRINKEVVALISQVIVDPKDKAFADPQKRIGKSFMKEEAELLKKAKGWQFKDSKQNGYVRRVVASPEPVCITNEKVIEATARAGRIVVAAGGGGIPVYKDDKGMLQAVEAVVDKDLSSALLAAHIHADELYILTDVPFVYKHFGTSHQEIVEFLNYADANELLEAGAFGEGTMAPKIKAALRFIEHGGQKSVITEATKLEDKTYGTKITLEYDPDDKPHHQLMQS
ncbi:carbamate kinase [Saccharicrinis sp. FJH54]|uniref:carbamate kinase n=1 Tax=Saccharicrinis sp. FJH54 TaxID=3344665 RepID=UPI0035D48D84